MEQLEINNQIKFADTMMSYTAAFPDAEFLAPDALYALASIGGNTKTIPLIPFPSDFDVKKGLMQLEGAYLQDGELTDLAREVIVAISWMQQSEVIAMLNEATFFYQEESLPVSVIVPNKTREKVRIAHRYKTAELLGVLGAFPWLTKPLTKTRKLSEQTVTVRDLLARFEGRENLAVSIYKKGKVVYNCIFIENDGGVIKYNETTGIMNEDAGRLWMVELIKELQVNKEFHFDADKRGGF